MASSPNRDSAKGRGKKRAAKYLSHANKKRKQTELRSGLQGFFITCVGGKERLSCREAIQLLDRFYENLGETKPSSAEKQCEGTMEQQEDSNHSKPTSLVTPKCNATSCESEQDDDDEGVDEAKGSSSRENIESLLAQEIAELRDTKQARFVSMETGCTGVIFIRLLRDASDPSDKGPNQVAEAILEDCIQNRKPLTRFCLRFLPVGVTCYASAEEVRKMALDFLKMHFPEVDKDKALKFAVVYEARANTSLDRMVMIDAVAKLVPPPHSVDLKNPDKTILVQVVKTICAIGVVNNYKKYAKYNVRELTSPKQDTQAASSS